ncbi:MULTISPECIES: hypothetical protein [unclassified Streptomyces]|uniref:hypothetical protein n=1 Tax=unclassified Streptomyces TaxID=2593676 RepID=UPI00163DC7A6|nr:MULTISPECIES: hypothetical protein [unclassified Streptomyces]
MSLYSLEAIAFWGIYSWFDASNIGRIVTDDGRSPNLLYYSFASQLPLGGGGQPTGATRPLALFQSLLSIALFGIWVSLLVARAITPAPNSIILCPRAVVVSADRKLGVILVNATGSTVTDLTIRATLKIGRRHASHAELSLPYLKNSVLLAKLIPLEPDFPPGTSSYDPSEDGLKVSITGTLHGSIVSFSTKYVFTRIITADSDNFMDRPEFQNPNLRDLEFWQLFVQPVPGAISVHDAIMRGSP